METAKELAPGVWEIPGFYSADEIDQLVNETEQVINWEAAHVGKMNEETYKVEEIVESTHRDAMVLNSRHIPRSSENFETSIASLCIPNVKSIWGLDDLTIEGTQFVRYAVGGCFNLHRDWGREFPRRCISVILYLNSEFDGGQLKFSEINYTYSPHAGACLLFPSEYMHASLPVISGTKIIMLTFLCSR